jgi:hydrogenase maturation protease
VKKLVIGIGNSFRRDDGVGLAVAERIAALDLPGVSVMTSDGEPAAIIDAWAGVPTTVVVDAAVGEHTTRGQIRRWTPDEAALPSTTSSHAFGLPQAYALGQALGRMPNRLVVFTVDIADAALGTGFSAPVAASVASAVDAVLTELTVDAPEGRRSRSP